MNTKKIKKFLFLTVLSVFPLLFHFISCSNHPDINMTILEPIESNKLILQRLAPDTLGGPDRWRASVLLRIDNNTGGPIVLQEIYINNQLVSDFLYPITIEDGDSYYFQNCNCAKDPEKDRHGKFIALFDHLPNFISVDAYFQEMTEPVNTFWATSEHVNDGGPWSWVGHPADLLGNEVWSASSNHIGTDQAFGLDTGVVGWNTTHQEWRKLRYPGADENEPETYRAYGKPVYSLNSGTVCFAMDDQPEWGTLNEAKNRPEDKNLWPQSPTTGRYHGGGNQIFIKNSDEIWYAAHLQPGSIPPGLLVPGTPVTKGQYLGKVGYSGDSGRPHVHISSKNEPVGGAPVDNPDLLNHCYKGKFRTMSFSNMQSINREEASAIITDVTQDLTQDKWYPMTNHSAPHQTGLLYPSMEAFFLDENFTDTQQYIGVFNEKDTIDLRVKLTGWDAFTDRWTELTNDSFRLKEVETLYENGARQYLGLYERAPGGSALIGETGWDNFVSSWKNITLNGQRLIDVDVFHDDGINHYIGVFEAGGGGHGLFGHQDWTETYNNWLDQMHLGLRLVDIDVITVDEAQQYVTVYREGTGDQILASSQGWEGFLEHWMDFSDLGYRLIDVETYMGEEGIRYYVSIFNEGNQAHLLYSLTGYGRFLEQVERNSVLGMKLIDVVVEQ